MFKRKLSKDLYDVLKDTHKELYVEKNGEYVLNIDDDSDALKRAKDHEVNEKKQAKKELAELREQFKELKDKESKDKEDGFKKSNDIASLEKSYEEKLKLQSEKYNSEIDGLKGYITKQLVDNEAMKLAKEISTTPSVFAKVIKERLKAEISDGKYETRVLDSKGEISAFNLDDLKKELLDNKDYAPILIGNNSSGGAGGRTPESNTPNKQSGSAEKTPDLSKMKPKEYLAHQKKIME